MSNGGACCILRICCPPLQQMQALATKMRLWFASSKGVTDESTPVKIATELLTAFDLGPKGMTDAVVNNWKLSDAELGAAVRVVFASAFAEHE